MSEIGLPVGIEQGFAWWCFENRGIGSTELIRAAAQIGYGGIDLIPEALWPMVADAGLKIVAVKGHESLEDGLNRPASSARIERELKVSIEKAANFGIPILICFSGNRGDRDDETDLKTCAETLARVAPLAEQAGVQLAVELLNSRIDHPGYQCDHAEWGVRLCERVGSPAVSLLYDIYHMQIMEGDLIRTIQRHHRNFSHYHTAGNPGRGELNADQEINYPAIYRAIAATGYRGYITHEFYPAGDPIESLRRALVACADALSS